MVKMRFFLNKKNNISYSTLSYTELPLEEVSRYSHAFLMNLEANTQLKKIFLINVVYKYYAFKNRVYH